MRNSTTYVNYEVLDQCISNLKQSINDTYIQIELGRLQQIFDDSTGESAAELQGAAYNLKEAYQFILDMMFETIDMLTIAKELFQEADTITNSDLGGGNES